MTFPVMGAKDRAPPSSGSSPDSSGVRTGQDTFPQKYLNKVVHPYRTILMAALLKSLFVCRALTQGLVTSTNVTQSPLLTSTCRNVPGNPGYPTNEQWAALNTTVSGRLVRVVPFVEFCDAHGGCTTEQSSSSSFRAEVPGAMNEVRLSLSVSGLDRN